MAEKDIHQAKKESPLDEQGWEGLVAMFVTHTDFLLSSRPSLDYLHATH